MKAFILAVPLLLAGCDAWNESDNARSLTGPTIEVHCDAAQPTGGATTAKIACPDGSAERKKGL